METSNLNSRLDYCWSNIVKWEDWPSHILVRELLEIGAGHAWCIDFNYLLGKGFICSSEVASRFHDEYLLLRWFDAVPSEDLRIVWRYLPLCHNQLDPIQLQHYASTNVA